MPAVAMLGPRQVGKTTLAMDLAEARPSIYLDLQSAEDRHRLDDRARYLSEHAGKQIILDEIHRVPALFTTLRGVIDKNRRAGRRSGQFIIMPPPCREASASMPPQWLDGWICW